MKSIFFSALLAVLGLLPAVSVRGQQTDLPWISPGSDAAGKQGYYDNSGRCIIPCLFDYASPFRDGEQITTVRYAGKYYLIDRAGNMILLEGFDFMPDVYRRFATVLRKLDTGYEYALIDLNFLGVYNLLLLRGDIKTLEVEQKPELYHDHATDLQQQVNRFNEGFLLDGSRMEGIETPFSYGMACYPEKHEEAPNMDSDIYYLKEKVRNGADYLVTQMFFDNAKYFAFVERCRAEGITIPIIPGIKPIVFRNQLTVLPRVFRSDIPEPFAAELRKCKTDDEAKEVGIEWAIQQCKELIAYGVPSLHFYTMMASESVRRIAKEIY